MIVTILTAALVLALDQGTKYWAQHMLQPVGDIAVWPGVLHWHYTRNTGAAFSMLQGFGWLFMVLAVVVAIAIGIYAYRYRRGMHPLLRVILGMIAAGALGNAIDRMIYGYVIDFIDVRLINFAIFNLADSALVCGCILLAVYILFIHDKYVQRQGELSAGGDDEKNAEG